MKKYNLSVIMRNAWKLRRMHGSSMSEALRQAWAVAKEMAKTAALRVKRWFLQKSFTQGERYAIETADRADVVKESAKAVLVKWVGKYGNVTRWVPKSCLE